MLQALALSTLLAALPLAAPNPPPPPPPAPAADAASSELAAEAPRPSWTYEGGAANPMSAADRDVVATKIRRSAVTSIVGGSVAVLGLSATLAAGLMLGVVKPKDQLKKLELDNGGPLPDDDPKKQRLEAIATTGPIVLLAGVGGLAAGALTAVIASRRLKKLRNDKRRSTVALAPAPLLGGGSLQLKVRF